MAASVHFWYGYPGEGIDMYYDAMLCRRCNDLISISVRKNFGRDDIPLIFEFAGHVAEMRYLKWKMRDTLDEGEYPECDEFGPDDRSRLSGEHLVVREFAMQFIEEKHRRSKNQTLVADSAVSKLKPKQRHAYDYIRENGPVKGLTVAKSVNVKLSTFNTHYVPALKECGVENVRDGDGYFVPKS